MDPIEQEPIGLKPLGAMRKEPGAKSVFVIIKYPKGHAFYEAYPEKYLVRRWEMAAGQEVAHPKEHCGIVDTLAEAHSYVTPGMECVRRPFEDQPTLLEVWL
jgi:hypothetical protein